MADKKIPVIGFRGVIESGKSTLSALLARYAQQKYHLHVLNTPMAGPLKYGLACMGLSKEKEPKLYRQAAQFIGTDIVRKQKPNHWVDLFKARLDEALLDNHLFGDQQPDLIFVDDIRFENEAAVPDLTFFLIRTGPGFREVDLSHESEQWNAAEEKKMQQDHKATPSPNTIYLGGEFGRLEELVPVAMHAICQNFPYILQGKTVDLNA